MSISPRRIGDHAARPGKEQSQHHVPRLRQAAEPPLPLLLQQHLQRVGRQLPRFRQESPRAEPDPPIPARYGEHVTNLSHLNIVYNDIAAVTEKDFMGWADSFDTIMFRNNKITHQEAHTFRRNLESMDKFSKTSEGLSKDWKVLTTNETQAAG